MKCLAAPGVYSTEVLTLHSSNVSGDCASMCRRPMGGMGLCMLTDMLRGLTDLPFKISLHFLQAASWGGLGGRRLVHVDRHAAGAL